MFVESTQHVESFYARTLSGEAPVRPALARECDADGLILGDTRLRSLYETIHNPRFPGGDALAAPLEALGKLRYRMRDMV